MSVSLRHHLLVVLLAGLTGWLPYAGAKADELAPGQVVEKVVCRADATQSYALYLPSAYSPSRRWPIIYAFDPGARGTVPVEQFRAAAEQYGYLVVGSHNSRNGPTGSLAQIVAALWEDTHARLAIDERRIYVTGFSGGARVAVSVAAAYKGLVAGVIACGAGFPANSAPAKETPFVFYGLVGDEDFNFPELKQVNKAFDSTTVPHRLAVFAGEHSWPPSEQCLAAIEWLELQAMKAGRKARDEALIAALWNKGWGQAQGYEAVRNFLQAYTAYDGLAADFHGLHDVTEAAREARQVELRKEYKLALKAEREQEQQQQAKTGEFFVLTDRLRRAEERPLAQSDLKRLVAGLKKQAEDQTKPGERLVARRLLAQFFISSNEESARNAQLKQYAQAADNLAVALEIRPERVRLLPQMAKLYAIGGDKRQALDALKRAAEKGAVTGTELEQTPELESLRREADYKRLLERLNAAPASGPH